MNRIFLLAFFMLAGVSCIGAVKGSSSICYVDVDSKLESGADVAVPLDSTAVASSIEARVSSSSPWGLEAGPLRVILTPVSAAEVDALGGRDGVIVTVDMRGQEIVRRMIPDPAADSNGFNSMIIDLHQSTAPGIFVGAGEPVTIQLPPLEPVSAVTARLFTTGVADVQVLCVETWPDRRPALMTKWTEDAISARFKASSEPLEGFWRYLDRENDPLRGVVGGNYRLALISDGRGGYDIIYCSGAVAEASRWIYGMRKGHISPTIFMNHYDLEWIDSLMEPVVSEMSASVEQGAILTLRFPLYSLSFRLAKER